MTPPARFPRLMISAASSGAGKTSWTLGLLKVFARRGLRVQAFKVGPDYIDPALHSLLTPAPSRNLDTRLLGSAAIRSIFSTRADGADLSVIEGAMGYYDGAGPGDDAGSAASLAALLDVPVLLVLDAKASGASVGATALGFLRYRRKSRIAGFLANRVGSPRHLETVRRAVEDATGLPLLGSLPKESALALPERHLGLVSGAENDEFARVVALIADRIEERCDLAKLLAVAVAAAAPPFAVRRTPAGVSGSGGADPVRIAVARDAAFSFYYEDNLDLLQASGAELAFFSPLADKRLPEGCAGLYLGGGYPELHGSALSANAALRAEIRDRARAGLPMLAECGGYMYLTEAIVDGAGIEYPMAGLFRGRAVMGRARAALGYYDGTVLTSTPFLRAGEKLRGHCFHWSAVVDSDPAAAPAVELAKPGERPVPEGRAVASTFASYLHVHFASHPALARNFVRACNRYRNGAHHD